MTSTNSKAHTTPDELMEYIEREIAFEQELLRRYKLPDGFYINSTYLIDSSPVSPDDRHVEVIVNGVEFDAEYVPYVGLEYKRRCAMLDAVMNKEEQEGEIEGVGAVYESHIDGPNPLTMEGEPRVCRCYHLSMSGAELDAFVAQFKQNFTFARRTTKVMREWRGSFLRFLRQYITNK